MPVTKILILRREKEFAQFFEESYKTEWHSVKRIADDTIQLIAINGTVWTVQRDLNFLTKSPRTFKNGAEITGCYNQWSMVFSCVAWLLMVSIE